MIWSLLILSCIFHVHVLFLSINNFPLSAHISISNFYPRDYCCQVLLQATKVFLKVKTIIFFPLTNFMTFRLRKTAKIKFRDTVLRVSAEAHFTAFWNGKRSTYGNAPECGECQSLITVTMLRVIKKC